MAKAIRMPLLSDTMTEGKIIQWNKKVGDKVKSDDAIAEVETDKATMEVVGYEEGTLLYIGVKEGEAAKVNEIIAIVGKKGEDYKSILGEEVSKVSSDKAVSSKKENDRMPASAEKKPVATLPEGAKVIRMPLLSDTMTEGKIIQWNKKVGDAIKSDDAIAEVETDKATMEVVGYEEGTLLYVGVKAGEAAKVNDIIAIVGKKGTDVSAFIEAEKNKSSVTTAGHGEEKSIDSALEKSEIEPEPLEHSLDGSRIKASPLAKKLAADKGIDISKIQGSGDGGRIIKKDVNLQHQLQKELRLLLLPGLFSHLSKPARRVLKIFPILKCEKQLRGDWGKANSQRLTFT